MNKKIIDEIFSRFQKLNPTPKIELDFTNNYTLFVAVVLSAQSTDKGVNKATKELFKIVNDPSQMLILGEENLKTHIKSIGLYNSKARHIIRSSEIMFSDYNNQLPETFDELCKLPGVGRKTANVLISTLFGEEAIAVDTHVFRVSNRLKFCKTKTPEATEKELNKIIPKQWKKYAHHWMVLHGRYICKARTPLCEICPINDLCNFKR
ncbi:MAG: endonuclease-3 [Candidatus Midichloriaceae bacterium]|jgi:endonuclease-3